MHWMFPGSWYLEHDVRLFSGVAATSIDPQTKVREHRGGSGHSERLLLACDAAGSALHQLSVPGADLDGVGTSCRTYLDALRLCGVRSSARSIVMIGSGFIGMEVAASLRSGGARVTVVTIDEALSALWVPAVSA